MADQRQGLWDFALQLYAAPGVGEACLTLQDECRVDVPLLLFSAWLSKQSVALTSSDLARIDGIVADWRSEVVQPLRAVRRRLKSGPYPAPTTVTEALRNGVKGVELSSEKIELAVAGDGRRGADRGGRVRRRCDRKPCGGAAAFPCRGSGREGGASAGRYRNGACGALALCI
ncbi:TIGR02444 family protein [Sinorhizobium fredii]|uniref:TIGR02444 family protein n=1 Tax=Rhizobium fredii TaxID=380 RepID=UPI0035165166